MRKSFSVQIHSQNSVRLLLFFNTLVNILIKKCLPVHEQTTDKRTFHLMTNLNVPVTDYILSENKDRVVTGLLIVPLATEAQQQWCSTSHPGKCLWAGKAVEHGPSPRDPAPMWVTRGSFWLLEFRSTQLWLMQPFWGRADIRSSLFISSSLSL